MRIVKAAIAVAILVAFVVAVRLLPLGEWIAQFQGWVRGVGPVGYAVYVIVYAVCCVFLIPALALTLGAGAIFGWIAGSVVNVIGATIGATLAFVLARTVLRQRVERMTEHNVRFRALDRAITREGSRILWLVRLSGFPPFTWVNYAFGLTGVRLAQYVWITLFGIIPGTLAYTYAGSAGAAALAGSGNRILLTVTAAGAVLVAVFIGRVAFQAIRRAGVDEEPPP